VISWLGTLLKWIILLPVLVVALLLAVANDQSVTVHLNPFDQADPVLRVDLALYQIAFIVFVVGALVGAFVAWSGQRKHRRRARRRGEEAAFWQARAETAEVRQSPPRASAPSTALLPRPERG
jgi:uncharacterized integral membrane protein